MEERVVEEIPLNTWEQVPQRLSMERRETVELYRNVKII